MSQVGVWDQGLFDRFHHARGETRRRLLGELLRVNEPLIKILVAQVSGVTEDAAPMPPSRRRSGAGKIVMRAACADVPWEDLMQAGREGMGAALERFNASKGKIAGYARWRILYSIQEMLKREYGIKRQEKGRPPEERPVFSYVDSYDEVERNLNHELHGLVSLDGTGISPEQVREWDRTGDFPETIEEARRRCYSIPARPIDAFLAARCMKRPLFRSSVWDLFTAFVHHQGETLPMAGWNRARFVRELEARGCEQKAVRVKVFPDKPWLKEQRVDRGVAGIGLVS